MELDEAIKAGKELVRVANGRMPRKRRGMIVEPAATVLMTADDIAALDALVAAAEAGRWRPVSEPPPKDKVFAITVAGPQIDFCAWDEQQGAFLDYYHKQRIAVEWPYMVAWKVIEPADVDRFLPLPPAPEA